MSEFKEGDVVQLKSGGPKMTYTGKESASHKGKVECLWFAEGIDSKLELGWFPPNSLILFVESRSSEEIQKLREKYAKRFEKNASESTGENES